MNRHEHNPENHTRLANVSRWAAIWGAALATIITTIGTGAATDYLGRAAVERQQMMETIDKLTVAVTALNTTVGTIIRDQAVAAERGDAMRANDTTMAQAIGELRVISVDHEKRIMLLEAKIK